MVFIIFVTMLNIVFIFTTKSFNTFFTDIFQDINPCVIFPKNFFFS